MPIEKREKVDATELFFFSCLSFLFGWNAYCMFLHLLLLGERELLLCERRFFFFGDEAVPQVVFLVFLFDLTN